MHIKPPSEETTDKHKNQSRARQLKIQRSLCPHPKSSKSNQEDFLYSIGADITLEIARGGNSAACSRKCLVWWGRSLAWAPEVLGAVPLKVCSLLSLCFGSFISNTWELNQPQWATQGVVRIKGIGKCVNNPKVKALQQCSPRSSVVSSTVLSHLGGSPGSTVERQNDPDRILSLFLPLHKYNVSKLTFG